MKKWVLIIMKMLFFSKLVCLNCNTEGGYEFNQIRPRTEDLDYKLRATSVYNTKL